MASSALTCVAETTTAAGRCSPAVSAIVSTGVSGRGSDPPAAARKGEPEGDRGRVVALARRAGEQRARTDPAPQPRASRQRPRRTGREVLLRDRRLAALPVGRRARAAGEHRPRGTASTEKPARSPSSAACAPASSNASRAARSSDGVVRCAPRRCRARAAPPPPREPPAFSWRIDGTRRLVRPVEPKPPAERSGRAGRSAAPTPAEARGHAPCAAPSSPIRTCPPP